MRIVVLGLSITSSWGNGHATTWRALLGEMSARGHDVTFLERDVPWYAANRDMPHPPFCRTVLYSSHDELVTEHEELLAKADAVIVGSYVPDGIEIGRWAAGVATGVVAFYDIDTPITVSALGAGSCSYIDCDLVGRYDLYLSFTGGPTLERLESEFGSPMARPLYCSVDAALYTPRRAELRWDLGYMGTYSEDRQPALERLLLAAARQSVEGRFVVAGPQYPSSVDWGDNVDRIEHLPPAAHCEFYAAQRYTLNLTRADMIAAGFSPSVRLFEAAACGVPIISDRWEGIETFFRPGREILIADRTEDVYRYLRESDEQERCRIGAAARERVLDAHTAPHRAAELERHLADASVARGRHVPAVVPEVGVLP
jgi:spore maturation protein CgeB